MNALQRLHAARMVLNNDGAMDRLTERHGEGGAMFTLVSEMLERTIQVMAHELGVDPGILLCLAAHHITNPDNYAYWQPDLDYGVLRLYGALKQAQRHLHHNVADLPETELDERGTALRALKPIVLGDRFALAKKERDLALNIYLLCAGDATNWRNPNKHIKAMDKWIEGYEGGDINV